MRLLFLGIIFSGLVFSACHSQQNEKKKIAITFDDLPTLSHGILSKKQQHNYFYRTLYVLKKHKVRSTGFVVGGMVNNSNKVLISDFIAAGHDMGNHSFKHYDLNKVDVNKYCHDILLCDSLLSKFSDSLKYFRYPFLHRGNTENKKDSVMKFLQSYDYTIAPVSIDSDETDFNIRFVKAISMGKHSNC